MAQATDLRSRAFRSDEPRIIGLVGASYIMVMPTALAQWQTTLAEVIIVLLFVPFLIRA